MTKMIGLPWRAVQCGASGYAESKLAHLAFGLASSFFWSLPAAGSGGAFSSSSSGFLHRGVDHLHLGLVIQADAAHDHHLFAGAHAVQDLYLVALAHAHLDGAPVRDIVRRDHQHAVPPSSPGRIAAIGTTGVALMISVTMATCTLVPGFSRSPGLSACTQT